MLSFIKWMTKIELRYALYFMCLFMIVPIQTRPAPKVCLRGNIPWESSSQSSGAILKIAFVQQFKKTGLPLDDTNIPQYNNPKYVPDRPDTLWTRWFNSDQSTLDNPEAGDNETIAHITEIYGNFEDFCQSPMTVQCRDTSTGLSWTSSGLQLAIPCTVEEGLFCLNGDQPHGAVCSDFAIRFKCAITYTAVDPPSPVYRWDFSTKRSLYGECPAIGKAFDIYPNIGGHHGSILTGILDTTQIKGSYPGSQSECVWPFVSEGTIRVEFDELDGTCLSNPSCCEEGFSFSVWLMILSTGGDAGTFLSSGADDFEKSYGVSLFVIGASTSQFPTLSVKISTELGLLETQHTIPKDKWFLLIAVFHDDTLATYINQTVESKSSADVVPRSLPILYFDGFTKLSVANSAPSFAMGELQVFNTRLTTDQVATIQSDYQTNQDVECKGYHTTDEVNSNVAHSYEHNYYWPPIPEGMTYFSFKVRAKNDATIGLSPTDSDVHDMYQILIGGWGNTASQIRLCKELECNGYDEATPTPNILSPNEYREFYVSLTGNQVLVGRVGGDPFVTLQHDTPYDVKYVGIISGWGSSADWIFCGYGGCSETSSCYAIDINEEIGISPGDYTPGSLTLSTCMNLCSFLDFGFSVVAGDYCYCRETSLPGQYVTNASECISPCTGDSSELCGSSTSVIQTGSCYTDVDFDLGDVFQSAKLGQSVAVPIKAESKYVPISIDYGDGTPVRSPSDEQVRPHVYALPGKYVASAFSSNQSKMHSDAFVMTAVTGVKGITLSCPEIISSPSDFECEVEVMVGSDMELEIMVDDEMQLSVHLGSSRMSPVGSITHDETSPLEDDTHTPGVIILPSTEVLERSYLVALEAYIYGDITQYVKIHIMRPSCVHFPGTVYCQESNTCELPSNCPLNGTTSTSNPAKRRQCQNDEIFCLGSATCVQTGNLESCPTNQDRYATKVNGVVSPSYEIINEIRVKPNTVGYNYFNTYEVLGIGESPLLMEIGYVLAISEPAAGLHVAYENIEDDEPSEISHTDNSKINKRHFLRAILSESVVVRFNATISEEGIHVVSAKVNSFTAEGGVAQTLVELVDKISGLTIEIFPKSVVAHQESVTVKAWIKSGSGVFFTWDWGDGVNETAPRFASNYSDYDERTHVYRKIQGNVTITITAWNHRNDSQNTTGVVEVLYPVQRHQYTITTSVTNPVPYVYPERVLVTFYIWLTFTNDEIVASNTYVTLTSYDIITNVGPRDLNVTESGTAMPITTGFDIPGHYRMLITVSNGFSQEMYNTTVEIVELIANHSCVPMYQPLSLTGEIQPGKGDNKNIFPADSAVIFINTVDAGTDMQFAYDVEGAETWTSEPTMSHVFSKSGVHTVYCFADNPLGPTSQIKLEVILLENIKGITVTDLGITRANQLRFLQIDINDPGTNSSLTIDYGDGTNLTLFGCLSCSNPFSDATWEGVFNFTTKAVSHIFETNGTFYVRIYGWNLLSEFEVVTLIYVGAYDCGAPLLSIRDGSPSWRSPRDVQRKDHVVIEAVTDLGRQCNVDGVQRTWEVQQINIVTGGGILESTLLTDLPQSDPLYIRKANTSEIRLPPYYPLHFGLYRFTHRINVFFTNGDIFNLFTEEHIYITPADLEVAILEGDTTSVTRGHGQVLLLQPGQLSIDPDQDSGDGQNFNSIKYYCRQEGEPWPIIYGGEIDEEPIPDELDPSDPLYMTGCFGTGPGRLNYTGSSYMLETSRMEAGKSYEIMVIVEKDIREGQASVSVTVKEGNLPELTITCNDGTRCHREFDVQIINPSSDFRIEADCTNNCLSQSYKWTLTVKIGADYIELSGWKQYATGTNTKSMFLYKEVFSLIPEGSDICFFVEVTNAKGEVGLSQMKATMNIPPKAGTCTVFPVDIVVFETITIICSNWSDENGIVQYEFYLMSNSSSVTKVLTFGSSSEATVAPPVASAVDDNAWTLAVKVKDALGATTDHVIGDITVTLSEEIERDLLEVVDGNIKRKVLYDELIIEDDSHAINWHVLQDASILNELHYLETMAWQEMSTNIPTSHLTSTYSDDYTLGLTSPVSTLSSNDSSTGPTVAQGGKGTTENNLSPAHQKELGRVTRAYIRKDLANLLSTSSMDSMSVVLLVSGATSVLSTVTDELSHDTLGLLGGIVTDMVDTYEELLLSTDQDEVFRVGANILDAITNVYKGSWESITNPMFAMDAFEDNDETEYSKLAKIVEESDLDDYATTLNINTPGLMPESVLAMKKDEAGMVTKYLDAAFQKLKTTLATNKVAGEPKYSLTTANGMTLTVMRGKISDLMGRIFEEGQGMFSVPASIDLIGSRKDSGLAVADADYIDVLPFSLEFNPYNFDITSNRISERSHVMGLSYHTRDQKNNLVLLPVQKTSQNIRIKVPRPSTDTPIWSNFAAIPHDDTGMSYHSLNISYNDTSLTVQIRANEPDVRYAVFLNHEIPPTRKEYLAVYVMPKSLTTAAGLRVSSKVYSIFFDNTVIGDNIGKYFLGLVEIDPSSESDNYEDIKLTPGHFIANYSMGVFTSGCSFWRENSQTWSSDGCLVDSSTDSRFTYCLCNHLTSFASTWIVPPTPLDFDYIFSHANFTDNITIYTSTIAIYVFFIILFIWARRADLKDLTLLGVAPLPDNVPTDGYYYEIVVITGHRKNSGTKSQVSFIVSGERDETPVRLFSDDKRKIFRRGHTDRFLMGVRRPLGTLNYMRIWHDNSGEGNYQSWFLKYVAIRDVQTRERFYFIVNKWFSVVEGDGQVDRLIAVAGKEQMQSFAHVFTSHTLTKLNDGHLWFSVFNRPPSTRFTRVQRVACCMMILWLEMMVNIMWYTVQSPPEAGRKFNIGPFSWSPAQISIGVQANLIVFPVSLLVVQLFRKARARYKRPSRIQIAQQQQRQFNDDSSKVELPQASIDDNKKLRAISPSNVIVTHGDDEFCVSDQQQLVSAESKKRSSCGVPWWAIYFAWMLSIVAILSATVITLFYGIQFGNETTKKWFTSVTVAFCTGVLFTQPLQAIAVGLFVALVLRTPNADEDEHITEDEEEYELKDDEEWLHNYDNTQARRSLNSAYVPQDPELLESVRLQRTKELEMHAIVREILVYFVFLFIVLIIAYSNQNTDAFRMKETYTNLLVHDDVKAKGIHRSFINAISVEKYWTWLEDMLIPQLHGGLWYNGDIDEELHKYTADKMSYMLGHAIIRQLRVKKVKCITEPQMRNVTPDCIVGYSWDNEDRESHGRQWMDLNNSNGSPEYTYMSSASADLDGYPFFGRHALYQGGGYTVRLDGDPLDIITRLERLHQEAWIDHYTRAVFVQFGSYNAHVNLFSFVTLLMEFLPTGAGYPYYRVDVIKLITYNDSFFIFRVVCEVTFFFFIVFFFFKEINNMRVEKKKYWKQFWNYIELFIIAFSVGAITAYFYRYIVTLKLLSIFKDSGDNVYINLQYVTYLNDIFHYMFGGVLFLASIKFLKLLRFNQRMHFLAHTIYYCRWDLFCFAILFSFVFFAFSLGFYTAFCRHLFDFADIIYSMETLLRALLGRFSFPELLISERILGPLFFFAYMCTMTYIVLNFFVTIIIDSFRKVRMETASKTNKYEILDFMLIRLRSLIGLKKSKPVSAEKHTSSDVMEKSESEKTTENDMKDKNVKENENNLKKLTYKIDEMANCIDRILYNGKRRNSKSDQKLTMKWYARRAYKLGPLRK